MLCVILHVGGKQKHPCLVSLFVIRDLVWQAFGRDFVIDWGTSNHASVHFTSHLYFKRCASICDSASQLLVADRAKEEEQVMPVVTQLTQEEHKC